MDTFLRQINLLRDFSLTLPINGQKLVNKLSVVTIPESTLIEVIGNSDKLFVGQVDLTEISLRPKKAFGQSNFIYATRLTAKVNSSATTTKIEGRISLTKSYPLMILSFMTIFFLVAIISFVQDQDIDILVLALLMTALTYFIFRNAIKTSKNFFEKELLSIINNSH
jgi:hypothetical protein